MTGSVCKAAFPNAELSVGTGRHPSTVCPRDSATFTIKNKNKNKNIKKQCQKQLKTSEIQLELI
jgi:hypothetical protein